MHGSMNIRFKNDGTSSRKVCHFCPIVTEIETRQQISIKINTKFQENPSGESPVIPCRQAEIRTNGRDKATFCSKFFAVSM